MPNLADSTNIDTTRLEPVRSGGEPAFAGIAQANTNFISPFFDSSLPVLASGGDIYARQFYNTGGFPQRRFLPVGG